MYSTNVNIIHLDAKSFEIDSIAGAYWKNDEKLAMLQRVYAVAWESQTQLKVYKRRLEEAKLRDHRMLGMID